jgi:hypothetical protein
VIYSCLAKIKAGEYLNLTKKKNLFVALILEIKKFFHTGEEK